MAGITVPVKAVDAIGLLLAELTEIDRQLSRRAFELFENRGGVVGHDLNDWLQAEKELLWRPCAELTETDTAIRASFALAGLTPKGVEVLAEPDRLTVRADIKHQHRKEEGNVHLCEFHQGRLYRSIALPSTIIPEKARGEIKEGMLTVTLPKERASAGKKIAVEG